MWHRLSMKQKNIIFFLFVFSIGLINFIYLKTGILWVDLLVRVPQTMILAWIYKVKVNPVVISFKRKWKLKGALHYLLLIVGFMEFMLISIFLRNQEHTVVAMKSESHLSALQDGGLLVLSELALSVLIVLPAIYALAQFVILFRDITVWTYNHRRSWFQWVVCIEEVFVVTLLTLLT